MKQTVMGTWIYSQCICVAIDWEALSPRPGYNRTDNNKLLHQFSLNSPLPFLPLCMLIVCLCGTKPLQKIKTVLGFYGISILSSSEHNRMPAVGKEEEGKYPLSCHY